MTKLLKSLWFILYAPLFVLFKRIKWDIIYCDDSFPYYPALIKLVSPKSKVIHYLGDFHLMYYFKGLIYRVLHYFEVLSWKKVDKIIGITPANARFIYQNSNKIAPLVSESVEEWDTPSKSPVTRLNDPKTPKIAQFHGLITKSKGLDTLLDVARELPDITFRIIGGGSGYKELQRNVPPNVVFYGWVSPEKVREYISTCDIGIAMRSDNPANQYNFTTSFLQYGIMKKPCIAPLKQCYSDMGWSWCFVNKYHLKLLIQQLFIDRYIREKAGQELYDYVSKNHEAKKVAENRVREVFNV